MLFTLLIFALILGFLIFAHEMGHFLAARLFGVKAEEFGFGFPPRIFGLVKNHKTKKWEFIAGNRELRRRHTIYSFNWIPLGGFVKIKGEDGDQKKEGQKATDPDSDSFTAQPIWQRVIILAAGVFLNFVAAALILAVGFFTGTPEPVADNNQNVQNARVQVIEAVAGSPAEAMGLKPGDEITKLSLVKNNGQEQPALTISAVSQVTEFLAAAGGQEILIEIKRGDDVYRFKGVPRTDPPAGEGALGIALTRTAIVSYPLLTSLKLGAIATIDLTNAMLIAISGMLKDLIVKGETRGDVAGPVGIVVLTNQAAEMGLGYLLQFAAILSINLAIINILPLPALDGGRILFLLIEKIKKSPVSQEIERKIHLTGFYLLIALMLFITVRDVFKFQDKFLVIWEKIGGIF